MDHNGDLGVDYDECVDMANTWAKTIGIAESYGNADTLNYAPACDWIANEPENHPVPGDIVIFKGGAFDPVFGHVALALYYCTAQRLRVFNQNFPDGSPCHVSLFDYSNCLGWWHPKKLGPHGASS